MPGGMVNPNPAEAQASSTPIPATVHSTHPMTAPSANPDAVRLASYLDQLHQTGYGNIDPAVQVATAQGAINHPNQVGVMDAIKNGMASAYKSVGQFFSEPSVEQPPTDAQRLHDHFQGTGIAPFQPSQNQSLQQYMQSHGYGKQLKANGAWSADWSSAQYQMGLAKQQQLGFGQIGVRALLGPLADMFLSHALPLINSMAASVWTGAGHTLALGASNTADILTGQAAHVPNQGPWNDLMFPVAGLMNFFGGNKPGTKSSAPTPAQNQQMQQFLQNKGYGKGLPIDGNWSPDWNSQYYQMRSDAGIQSKSVTLGDRIGAAIQSATNLIDHTGHVSAEQYMDTPIGWHDMVTVMGTALMASSIGTFAKVGESALGSAVETGMGAGASNAAKAMFTPVSTGEANAATTTLMNSVLPQIGTDGLRRFMMTKSLQNMPVLNFITRGLNKVATDMGEHWELARTPVVQAYRLPAVQALGKIGVATSTLGIKSALIGEGEKFAGDPNGPQAQVLQHLQPIAGWEGRVLNGLQLFAQRGVGDQTLKQEVGSKIAATNDQLSASLNESALIPNWERVMRKNGWPGYQQSVANAAKNPTPSSAATLDRSIFNDFDNKAAYHQGLVDWQNYVQSAESTGRVIDSSRRAAYIQEVSHVIRNDPQMMDEARRSYHAGSGQYAADLQNAIVNMKSDPTRVYSGSFPDKLAADDVMHDYIMPNQKHLISPQNMVEGLAERRMAVADVKNQTESGQMRDPALYAKYTKQLSGMNADQLLAAHQAVTEGALWKPITPPVSKSFAAKFLAQEQKAGRYPTGAELAKDPRYLAAAEKAQAKSPELFGAKDVSEISRFPANKATFFEALKDRLALYTHDSPEWATTSTAADATKLQQIRSTVAGIPSLKLPPKFMGKVTLDDARLAAMNGERSGDGSVGYMKNERQSAGDAQAKAYGFAIDYGKVNPAYHVPETFDEFTEVPGVYDGFTATSMEKSLRQKMLGYLGSELGVSIKELYYVPTQNLLRLIIDQSHKLPADLHLADSAPPALIEGARKLDKLGYKPVIGTDIGHQFFDTPADMSILGEKQNLIQRAATQVGVNFTHVDPHIAAAHSYSRMLNTIQDHLNAADTGVYPIWMDAKRGIGYLREAITPDMSFVTSAAFRLAASRGSRIIRPLKGSMWRDEIKTLMEGGINHDQPKMNRNQAIGAIQDHITNNSGPQFWTPKQVIDALTQKGMVRNNAGDMVTAPGMSVKAASNFYYAMRQGLRDTPAWVGGASPFLKALDSSFGLAGVKIMLPSGRRVLDLAGNVKPVLMDLRYQGSYRFAFLRVVKTAAKGVTENIPYTTDAGASMKQMGITDEAYKLRNDYLGPDRSAEEASDYVNQEWDKADMFNVYQPRAIEARIIWYLHQQALEAAGGDITKIDKTAVLKQLDNIFSYGARTAAEKSVNAFFFPFSFEKTVVRQLGGYLLDHPIARLATAGAVSAYDSADGQQMKKWMESNIPLFKEVERFNPFFHGIGVGQTGGILRLPAEILGEFFHTIYPTVTINGITHDPEKVLKQLFLDMMSPKPITTIASAKAAVALIPSLSDLNKILLGVDPSGKKPLNIGGEFRDSAQTLKWEIGGVIRQLRDEPPPDYWAPRGYLSYDNQMTGATSLSTRLFTKLATTLEANRNGYNYLWPNTFPLAIRGKKVDSETIRQLVHVVYPKSLPSSINKYVEDRRTAGSEERGSLGKVAPAYVPTYDKWLEKADMIQSLISHQEIDTKTLAAYTIIMQSYAKQLSAQDPSFAGFYKHYYQTKFGPLGGL